MPQVATIGVYGFSASTFTGTLWRAAVRRVFDVRQRRGVRGREYAWANAARLEAALAEAGIEYEHHPELAPTTALRELQYAEDDRAGVGKRERRELAPAYREAFVREILDGVDVAELARSLSNGGLAALLCVETEPAACHRSLVADRLAAEHGFEVVHLRPRFDAARAHA
jgi:uncharacterized protein (DUF488 family)